MSFFKDVLKYETSAVFLNGDEFAEEVEIDGVAMLAVRSERSTLDAGRYAPEIPGRVIVLHVHTDQLPSDIDMGGSVMLDGELCTVASRHDVQGGITRLELERNGY